MKYNLSKIMLKAWKIYRKTKGISLGESLHRAWLSAKAEEINAKRIETAKQAVGITEEINTFAKWKELGYKVVYGSKAIASDTVGYSIDNVLDRLRQQGIEIERFTHHVFRDTFATRYIEEGGNMQTLKNILGHSSLAMTADLYSHVLPDTKQQEMKQIENAFTGVAVL